MFAVALRGAFSRCTLALQMAFSSFLIFQVSFSAAVPFKSECSINCPDISKTGAICSRGGGAFVRLAVKLAFEPGEH